MSTDTKAPPKAVTKYDVNRPSPDGVTGLQKMSAGLLPQIQAAMPGYLAKNAERFIRCLMTECQKSVGLLDCTARSLFGGVIQAAQLGLELGGPAGQCYLIPFKGEASLVIGYKGFITLAHRSSAVGRITPRIVFEGDAFNIQYGSDQRIEHKPNFTIGAKPVGYYCSVVMANGGTDFEYMTLGEVVSHRDRFALSKKGPWLTSFDEMAKKTTIRKIAKRLPLSVEWVAAATLDEQAEMGIPQNLGAALILEASDEEKSDFRARLDKAKQPNQAVAAPTQSPVGQPTGDPSTDEPEDLFENATGQTPNH